MAQGSARAGVSMKAIPISKEANHRGLAQYLKPASASSTCRAFWRRSLGPELRCLVLLERLAEHRPGKGAGNAWFRLIDDRPAFFAGILVRDWTNIRKLKDGETTDDLYAFLTCEPNGVVGRIHPKAMPVILTEDAEIETWLSAPWPEARMLQRPLDDALLCLTSCSEAH